MGSSGVGEAHCKQTVGWLLEFDVLATSKVMPVPTYKVMSVLTYNLSNSLQIYHFRDNIDGVNRATIQLMGSLRVRVAHCNQTVGCWSFMS